MFETYKTIDEYLNKPSLLSDCPKQVVKLNKIEPFNDFNKLNKILKLKKSNFILIFVNFIVMDYISMVMVMKFKLMTSLA